MIKRVLDFCIRERLVVFIAAVVIVAYGWYATKKVPLDAIPNVSENQVIVLTEWMGRSPKDVEDQITYPMSVALQAVPGAKSVRGKSMFGFSFVQVTFGDEVDFYWARSRVAEQLSTVAGTLPEGVTPRLAPDATALGQIYYYVLQPPPGMDLAELRSKQDSSSSTRCSLSRAWPRWRRSAVMCANTKLRSIPMRSATTTSRSAK